MKKNLLTALLALCLYGASGQNGLCARLRLLIQQTHPEISIENKLIAVYVWEIGDDESRKTGQSFEKAFEVYRAAKLKGGSKGLIVVGVNRDNLTSQANITLQKDGVVRTIAVKQQEVPEAQGIRNMVFDAWGNEVYSDLGPEEPYKSIQKLITR